MYQAAIEPAGNQFVVNFAYGRRGSTLNTGTKTCSPVDYDAAKKIFTKLVNEKKAKGYTEGESGTPYQHTDKQSSGILPQLLNPIEEADVERLLHDDDYCAQEKFDGRHILIRRQDAQIEGINKKGLLVGLPETVSNDIRNLPGNFIPDGESVGDDYHAFDLLELDGENCGRCGIGIRLACLMNLLLSSAQHRHVRTGRDGVHYPTEDRTVAAAAPGKPRGHRVQAVGRAIHTGQAQQRRAAVEIQVLRHVVGGRGQGEHPAQRGTPTCSMAKRWIPCGNVTIPANHDIPKVGAVVEVRYLYAHRESGALYQPVYLGPRDDVEPGECLVSQLKYKAKEESC